MEQYISKDKIIRALAAMTVLDTIMTPPKDDWLRIINRGISPDHTLWFIIDNGSGDRLSVFFTETGILIKGFDHENSLNQFAADEWDNSFFEHIFADVPKELLDLLSEDERDNTTFCMCFVNETGLWMQNEVEGNDGGKVYLLGYIYQDVKSFYDWAEGYYESEFNYNVIQKLFETGILTIDDILELNPDCNAERILEEISNYQN